MCWSGEGTSMTSACRKHNWAIDPPALLWNPLLYLCPSLLFLNIPKCACTSQVTSFHFGEIEDSHHGSGQTLCRPHWSFLDFIFILSVLSSGDEISCCQPSLRGWEWLWTSEPLPTPFSASEGWDCRSSASRLARNCILRPPLLLPFVLSLHCSVLPVLPFLLLAQLFLLRAQPEHFSHYRTASQFSSPGKFSLFLILSCFLRPRVSGWLQGTKTYKLATRATHRYIWNNVRKGQNLLNLLLSNQKLFLMDWERNWTF